MHALVKCWYSDMAGLLVILPTPTGMTKSSTDSWLRKSTSRLIVRRQRRTLETETHAAEEGHTIGEYQWRLRWGRCYFQLRDAASLGAATERLNKARVCLQHSHGPNLERIKVLHGDFSPELATCANLLSLPHLQVAARRLPCADPLSGQDIISCSTGIARHAVIVLLRMPAWSPCSESCRQDWACCWPGTSGWSCWKEWQPFMRVTRQRRKRRWMAHKPSGSVYRCLMTALPSCWAWVSHPQR